MSKRKRTTRTNIDLQNTTQSTEVCGTRIS